MDWAMEVTTHEQRQEEDNFQNGLWLVMEKNQLIMIFSYT